MATVLSREDVLAELLQLLAMLRQKLKVKWLASSSSP